MTKVLKVGEMPKQLTLEEFEALLVEYKKLNPAKYAIKLANGEFDKFRSQCVGFVPPKPKETPKEVKETKEGKK